MRAATGALLLLTSVAGAIAGCGAGERLTAAPAEYASFRRTRLADSVEARLRAGHAYLKEYPRGHWAPEVQSWFTELEPRYYAAARNNIGALELYLETLPRGPHASGALTRLVELERIASNARWREQRDVSAARAIEAELRRAERGRRELVSSSLAWIERITRVQGLGLRLSDFDPSFLTELGIGPDGLACTEAACEKSIHFVYGVPEAGRVRERNADLSVRLELEAQVTRRAVVEGAEWFSRLAESATLSAVGSQSFQDRAEGIGHAVYLIGLVAEPRFPERRCRKPAVSPIVMLRECDGLRLVAHAGLAPGDLDRVWVELLGLPEQH